MAWERLGRVFTLPTNSPWARSHAATPIALALGERYYRVYVSARDERSRSQIGSFEFSFDHGLTANSWSAAPHVGLGDLGTFDDSGAVGGWITRADDGLYLYYAGWHLGVSVPFYFFMGLAISRDGGTTFEKYMPAPLLGPGRYDPCLVGVPCVLREPERWRMWYASGTRWELEEGQPKHFSDVKYAESPDGLTWTRNGEVCVDFLPGEYAIGRPSVLREDNGVYRMWYSYRGDVYRIGYAESLDGLRWQRKDAEVGIEKAASGWDSEMIEYGYAFKDGGDLYMLYNGNGYGATGVGLARWVD